jgi:hypothetical protein
MRWVIWSEEHAAWWGPARWGYTESLAAAGRYSQEEALAIVKSANLYCKGGTWKECAFPDPLASARCGTNSTGRRGQSQTPAAQ